jgi:MFS transporter, ACS family, solute carrier family 17 (sodium-dependent inorganic phosphate cotransporter), other
MLLVCIIFPRYTNAFGNPNKWKSNGLIVTLKMVKEESIRTSLEKVNSFQYQSLPQNVSPKLGLDKVRGLLSPDISRPEDKSSTLPLIMIFLFWIVAFVSSLDRVAMSVAILPMSEELGYTDSMKGQVSSMYSIGYGLAILPVGVLLSEFSPTFIMAIGLCIWSIATLATPDTVGTWTNLLMGRAALGAAESVVQPALQRLIASWIPPDQKSIVVAIVGSGFSMGTIAAYAWSPYIVSDGGGWRDVFSNFGILGLGCLVPWILLARDTPVRYNSTFLFQPFKIAVQEKKAMNKIDTNIPALKSASLVPMKEILSSRGVKGIVVAHAANNWGMYILLSWTPTFYAEQYGLDLKDSAWLSIYPVAMGAVGGLFAGFLADTWIQRNQDFTIARITFVRKFFQSISLFGPAICLVAMASHIPDQPHVAQSLLICTVGLQSFNTAGYGPAIQEKAGPKWSGFLYGITALPGVLVGSLGVYTTGRMLQMNGENWSLIFSLTALVYTIGATGFLLLYDAEKEFD